MNFFEKLEKRCKEINSLLCVGLDPRVNATQESEYYDEIMEKNKKIIDAVKDYTACFKPNSAFYEACGPEGMKALKDTISYIPEGIPVLLDAKRCDVGSTAEAYAKSAFEYYQADAITLSPYLGKSSIEPFLKYKDKGLILLIRTSNPGAEEIQELKIKGSSNDESLFMEMAKECRSWGDNIAFVVRGNGPDDLKRIRDVHSDVWILAPGIGAQGGNMIDALTAGMRSDGLGLLPNVSRSIANADDPGLAAKEYVKELNDTKEKIQKSNVSESIEIDFIKNEVIKGIIDTECFMLGEFTLKSGKISPFYTDLRKIQSIPGVLKVVAKAYASLLKDLEFDRIAGIPLAGLPLATAVSLEMGIPLVYPRMNAKSHGSGRLVEGSYKKGEKVVLLDDLITTGKSKLEAVDVLKEAGLVVTDLVVLFERGAQGRKDMTEAGINLYSYAPIQDVFDYCYENSIIDIDKKNELEEFVKE